MTRVMKGKSQSNGAGTPTLWRIDFRDTASLPDTKVVRTGFLINVAPLLLMLGLLMLFAYKEYVFRVARNAVMEVEQAVEASATSNRTVLFMGSEFRKLSRQAEEVFLFKEVPLDVAAFLRLLPMKIPEAMTLFRLEVDQLPREDGTVLAEVLLIGTILPDSAMGPSVILEGFQRDISTMAVFSQWAVQPEIRAFGRNKATGDFDFEVRLAVRSKGGSE
ncbi:MAG: hypothetical protein RL648_1051 [Verrucomicrobiota bacterium]|jgi:hypothetical protein